MQSPRHNQKKNMRKENEHIIRELRMDFKLAWLERIMKDYFRESLQEFLTELKQGADDETPLLTIGDIAEKFKVTKATIHNWKNRGLIVGHKLGKNRYYTVTEVSEALKRHGWERELSNLNK